MNAVLKAGVVPAADQLRRLQSPAADTEVVQPQPRVPGRWLSEAELETLLADAFDQGVREGQKRTEHQLRESSRRDAEAAARQALQKALADHQAEACRALAAKWQGLATQLSEQWRALGARAEAEVSEWTFVATTRLLGRMSDEQLRESVCQVLDEAGLRDPIQVLVHPDDAAVIGAEAGLWPPEVQFVGDASVKLGGCLIRAPQQTLDARLEVQLAFLRQALDTARRERQGGSS